MRFRFQLQIILISVVSTHDHLLLQRDSRARYSRCGRDATSAYRSMGCTFDCGSCEDLADFLVDDEMENMVSVDKNAA